MLLRSGGGRYKKRDFYLIDYYNLYGFNIQMIKGWKKLYVENEKFKGGKMHIGFPNILVINGDTLFIMISQLQCNKDHTCAFCDDFVSSFHINNSFKELKLSQKEITYKYQIAKDKGGLLLLDSVYNKAIRAGIDSLIGNGILRQNIYTNSNYFPFWMIGSILYPQENIIEESKCEKHLNSGHYIIGWPFLTIEKGHVAVSMYCVNKQWGEKRLIARVEYVFDDKAYR
ncbi:hypothetical protein JCM15908A_18490 [Prevotella dentasini JCM 15908]